MPLPYKYIIFNTDNIDPVAICKNLAEATKGMADLKGKGNYMVKPYKNYIDLIYAKAPEKYAILTDLLKERIEKDI